MERTCLKPLVVLNTNGQCNSRGLLLMRQRFIFAATARVLKLGIASVVFNIAHWG